MKKLYAVLLVLMLFFAACGDEPTNGVDATNMDLVPANLQKLMTSGDQIISDTVEGYTGITNAEMKDLIKVYADYTLFPVDFESGYTLQDRMKAYLGSDNNVVNAYRIQQNYLNGVPLTDGIDNLLPRHALSRKISLGKIGKVLKIVAPIANLAFPGAGAVCTAVGNSLVAIDQAKKQRAEAQTTAALGKTLDAFIVDTRKQFGDLRNRMDVTIGQLNSIKGDISLMQTSINDILTILQTGGMDEVKTSFDAFCQGYKDDATITDASNRAYFYYVTSSRFNEDLNKFFISASNIQRWAIQPANTNVSGYTYWVDDDLSLSTNYTTLSIEAKVALSTDWSSIDYTISYKYPNPKRMLALSIGNLDYLSKMFLTRLEMNSVLYSGSILSNHNVTLANSFLARIESAGIKHSVVSALNQMDSALYGFGGHYMNIDIDGLWEPIGGALVRSIRVLPCDGSSFYVYDGNDARFAPGLEPFVKQKLPVHLEAAKQEYLIHFLARLVALETILKSYQ